MLSDLRTVPDCMFLPQVVGVSAKQPSAAAEASSTTECAICLEAVEQGAVLRTLPCLHKFHKVRGEEGDALMRGQLMH